MRFLLEQRDFTREDVKSLLLRLRDECALVDREFRVVNERIRQVVVLRPEILFLLLVYAQRDKIVRSQTHIRVFLTFLPFFSPPPSVPMPDSGAPSPSLSLSYGFTAAGGDAGRCPVSLASAATSTA